ncbi:hypothetical protein PG996_001148 [Apiospora saccharicola]|uniref:Uncharacterized protein n=1 Tax=Apiospora saccharicola TaxID=335842 RepID=A0ABR1WFS9_9PEZI
MSLTKLNSAGVYVVEVTPSAAPYFEALWKCYAPQFNTLSTAPSSVLPSKLQTSSCLAKPDKKDGHEKRAKDDEQSDLSDPKLEELAHFLEDLPNPCRPKVSVRESQKRNPYRRRSKVRHELPKLQEVKDHVDAQDEQDICQKGHFHSAYIRHPPPYPPHPAPPPPNPKPWPNQPRPRPGLPGKRKKASAAGTILYPSYSRFST